MEYTVALTKDQIHYLQILLNTEQSGLLHEGTASAENMHFIYRLREKLAQAKS